MAVCDYARHVVGMDGANSTEFDPETPFPVIDLLPEQEVRDMGGTMRLGADPVKLHDGTRAREVYGEAVIYERHRHRYEVNNHLRKRLEHAGLVCSGTSPDDRLVEIVELPEHLFFVASQFHPEFKSRPAPAAAFPRVRGGGPRAGAPGRARGPSRHRVVPPSPEERERLLTKFARFCEIESLSGNERAMADAVIAELRALRLEEVEEDDSGAETGSNAGNLFARVPGPRAPGRSCSAPTWTRSRSPRRSRWCARRGSSATATRESSAPTTRPQLPILAAVRHLVHTRTPVGVELLFTTSEEPGSAGPRPSTSSGFAPSTASSSTTLRPSVSS